MEQRDMEQHDNDHEQSEHGEQNVRTALGFLAGVVVGGLAGAGTALLLAPQSGKRTRDQIRHKGEALRDDATDTIEDAMSQARTSGRHLSARVHKQAAKIQQRGQDMLDEQKERWSPVVEAGQKAVQGSAKN